MLELSAKAEKAIHMEQGEPDFITPNFISEAAIEAIRKGFTPVQYSGIGYGFAGGASQFGAARTSRKRGTPGRIGPRIRKSNC